MISRSCFRCNVSSVCACLQLDWMSKFIISHLSSLPLRWKWNYIWRFLPSESKTSCCVTQSIWRTRSRAGLQTFSKIAIGLTIRTRITSCLEESKTGQSVLLQQRRQKIVWRVVIITTKNQRKCHLWTVWSSCVPAAKCATPRHPSTFQHTKPLFIRIDFNFAYFEAGTDPGLGEKLGDRATHSPDCPICAFVFFFLSGFLWLSGRKVTVQGYEEREFYTLSGSERSAMMDTGITVNNPNSLMFRKEKALWYKKLLRSLFEEASWGFLFVQETGGAESADCLLQLPPEIHSFHICC